LQLQLPPPKHDGAWHIAREYILETEVWSAQVFNNDSWTHIKKALRRCLGGKRQAAHKLQFRLLPTLSHHYKRNGKSCPHYPSFHHKDFECVFHCNALSATSKRVQCLATFVTALTTQEVGTYLLEAILTGLHHWLEDTLTIWPHPAPHPADHYGCLIHASFYHQDDIMDEMRHTTTTFVANLAHMIATNYAATPWTQLWSLSLNLWKEHCDAMYGINGLLTLRNMEKTTAYHDQTPIPPPLSGLKKPESLWKSVGICGYVWEGLEQKPTIVRIFVHVVRTENGE
jgi:hypothetical protein